MMRPSDWAAVLLILPCLLLAYLANANTLSRILTITVNPVITSGLPCDIYAANGTPCVSAHSTVRALYGNYNGSLYQVQRSSDNAALNVGLLSPGGYVNVAPEDTFCSGTSCTYSIIYDQSPQHNDLTRVDGATPAQNLQLTIAGHNAYGIDIEPNTGFSNRDSTGMATGSQAQGIYMVTSSNNTNGGCCFSYGNAERKDASGNPPDAGNGTIHVIDITTGCWFPCVYGNGPWVVGDFENGWFWTDQAVATDPNDTGVHFDFLTAMSSTDGTNTWNRKSANAQGGGLTTWFSGQLPVVYGGLGQSIQPCIPGGDRKAGGCYAPLALQGALILGVGGDNSRSSTGYFYEGAITIGRPSDSTDDAIQASIVGAHYGQ
jgi:hypothetical protein